MRRSLAVQGSSSVTRVTPHTQHAIPHASIRLRQRSLNGLSQVPAYIFFQAHSQFLRLVGTQRTRDGSQVLLKVHALLTHAPVRIRQHQPLRLRIKGCQRVRHMLFDQPAKIVRRTPRALLHRLLKRRGQLRVQIF